MPESTDHEDQQTRTSPRRQTKRDLLDLKKITADIVHVIDGDLASQRSQFIRLYMLTGCPGQIMVQIWDTQKTQHEMLAASAKQLREKCIPWGLLHWLSNGRYISINVFTV